MPKKYIPTDILHQAQRVLTSWERISDSLAFGDLNSASLRDDLIAARTLREEMAKLEATMTDMRNRRDDLYAAIWQKVKRVRAGVKGVYGDDSSQYEIIGGTRLSERKNATRRASPQQTVSEALLEVP